MFQPVGDLLYAAAANDGARGAPEEEETMSGTRGTWLAAIALCMACNGGSTNAPADDATEDAAADAAEAPAPSDAEDAGAEDDAEAAAEVPGKATPVGTETVTLPTGKSVEAEKFTAPAAGTVEESILSSISLIRAGEFETFMDEWCHESYCGSDKLRENMTSYVLPAAKGTSGQCIVDDGESIIVTRRELADDGSVRVYVFCGDSRMPAPSSHVLVGERYLVSSLSW